MMMGGSEEGGVFLGEEEGRSGVIVAPHKEGGGADRAEDAGWTPRNKWARRGDPDPHRVKGGNHRKDELR